MVCTTYVAISTSARRTNSKCTVQKLYSNFRLLQYRTCPVMSWCLSLLLYATVLCIANCKVNQSKTLYFHRATAFWATFPHTCTRECWCGKAYGVIGRYQNNSAWCLVSTPRGHLYSTQYRFHKVQLHQNWAITSQNLLISLPKSMVLVQSTGT